MCTLTCWSYIEVIFGFINSGLGNLFLNTHSVVQTEDYSIISIRQFDIDFSYFYIKIIKNHFMGFIHTVSEIDEKKHA